MLYFEDRLAPILLCQKKLETSIPGRVTVNGHSATYAACTVPTNTKMSLRPIFRAGILMPIFSSRFCSELILGFSVHHGASLEAPTMSLDVY
ncbi:hypothetical protein T01_12573 [Trichinella spiralis]|uniref:Uncharacterized protein n=1 Tax=Trichinella spiralis TaxID=6334 RepID=A0A0V1BQV2_TRISP|nr:hypothetical protein T01_12573 [Trichinella spiralis]